MDDALLVGGVERLGDLSRKRQCLSYPEWPAGDPVGERLSWDQLHHQGADAIRLLDAVNCRDVWMVERSQHARFTFKARQAVVVGP